ncbi:hypothetical protein PR048_018115 [Dryococelus australis]|uniref:Uncharacterized protein n=1 Tax=Dryococelus australis TaxID=614101 RepID=A0ABQ9HBH8_9NEOP|nr:hypothetical protein PR048_018115 [Dryococelus australis]
MLLHLDLQSAVEPLDESSFQIHVHGIVINVISLHQGLELSIALVGLQIGRDASFVQYICPGLGDIMCILRPDRPSPWYFDIGSDDYQHSVRPTPPGSNTDRACRSGQWRAAKRPSLGARRSNYGELIKVLLPESQQLIKSRPQAPQPDKHDRSKFECCPALLASHIDNPGSIPGRLTPDFSIWDSCLTVPLVGGFSWGSPVSPVLSFRHCSILTSITFIGSQDLGVKSRSNLFTHFRADFNRTDAPRNLASHEPQANYTSASLEEKYGGDISRLDTYWRPGVYARELGATVVEWLDCSPATLVNWVQSPSGSLLDFRKWESCQVMSLVEGFFH